MTRRVRHPEIRIGLNTPSGDLFLVASRVQKALYYAGVKSAEIHEFIGEAAEIVSLADLVDVIEGWVVLDSVNLPEEV